MHIYLQDMKFLWSILSLGQLYTDTNTIDDDTNDDDDDDNDTWQINHDCMAYWHVCQMSQKGDQKLPKRSQNAGFTGDSSSLTLKPMKMVKTGVVSGPVKVIKSNDHKGVQVYHMKVFMWILPEFQEWLGYYDDKYIKKWLMRNPVKKDQDIMQLYQNMALQYVHQVYLVKIRTFKTLEQLGLFPVTNINILCLQTTLWCYWC